MTYDINNHDASITGSEIHCLGHVKTAGAVQSIDFSYQTFVGDCDNNISGVAEKYEDRM